VSNADTVQMALARYQEALTSHRAAARALEDADRARDHADNQCVEAQSLLRNARNELAVARACLDGALVPDPGLVESDELR